MDDNSAPEKKDGIFKKLGGSIWKKIPITLRLKIILIGSAILAVVILIIIIAAAISSFLPFSDALGKEEDMDASYKEDFEEYWYDLCEDDSDNCTDKQKQATSELKAAQLAFYNKLDSIMKKNSDLTEKQKYIVLTTIFYNNDISEFDFNDYTLEGDDEINYAEDAASMYQEEKDTLKNLFKQFKVYMAACEFPESVNNYDLTYDGKGITFGFWQYLLFKFGKENYDIDGFKEAKEACEASGGAVKVYKSSSSEASEDNYYDYLLKTDFLDKRETLKDIYIEYAKNKNLSTTDFSTWDDIDLENVRQGIIDDIKEIVENYIYKSSSNSMISYGAGTEYWWPIGSAETENKDGILFASGTPQATHISSKFGYRNVGGNASNFHKGIDIGTGGEYGLNVIASIGGTVIKASNTCPTTGSLESTCGGYQGNSVRIQDANGNITVYAHLMQDSITVSEGDVVSQGQVIGKLGSSGTSSGPHLHFEIQIGGTTPVDPLTMVSMEDPRPEPVVTGSDGGIQFKGSPMTKTEFVAAVQKFYQNKSCSGKGCISFKNQVAGNGANEIYEAAEEHGINPQIVIARSENEGYSPGTGYNYFGYGVYNGMSSGTSFSSFKSGMLAFFENASQYNDLFSMMSKYGYLGDYWYNPGSSGLGGCYYSEYIYDNNAPERVKNACAAGKSCTKSYTSNCVATTQEDKDLYTSWLIKKMKISIDQVFN